MSEYSFRIEHEEYDGAERPEFLTRQSRPSVLTSTELKGFILIIIVAFSAYLTIVQIVNTYPPAGILKSFSVQSLRRPSSSDTYLMGDSLVVEAQSDWASQYDLRVYANSSTVFQSRVAGGSHLRVQVPLVPADFASGKTYTLSLNAFVLNNPIPGASYTASASYDFDVASTQTTLGLNSTYDTSLNWLYSLANLTDSNGYPVANETVSFYLQPKSSDPLTDGWIPLGSCLTDDNGTALMTLGLPLFSNMTVEACHEGNENFGQSEATADVQVTSNFTEGLLWLQQTAQNTEPTSWTNSSDVGTVDINMTTTSIYACLPVKVNVTYKSDIPLDGSYGNFVYFYLDNNCINDSCLLTETNDGSSYVYSAMWPWPEGPNVIGNHKLIAGIVQVNDTDPGKDITLAEKGTGILANNSIALDIAPCPTNLVLNLPEATCGDAMPITVSFNRAWVYNASDDGEFTANSLAPQITYDGLNYALDEPVDASVPVYLYVNGSYPVENWTDTNGVASFTHDLSSSGVYSGLNVTCATDCSSLLFNDSVAESIVGVTMVNVNDANATKGDGLFSLTCTVAGQASTGGLDNEPIYVQDQNQVELTASLGGTGVSEPPVSMLAGEATGVENSSTWCSVPHYSNLLRVVSLYDTNPQNTTAQTPWADVTGDGKVDGRDITIVAKAFGTGPGMPRWNWRCDLNLDGKVDGRDITICAKSFGTKVGWIPVPSFTNVSASFENGQPSSLSSSGCIVVPPDALSVSFSLDGNPVGAVVEFFGNASLLTDAGSTDDSGVIEASWTPSSAATHGSNPYAVLAWLPSSLQVATTQPTSETTVTDSLSTAMYLNVTRRPVSLILTSDLNTSQYPSVEHTLIESPEISTSAGTLTPTGFDYTELRVGYQTGGFANNKENTYDGYVSFDTPSSATIPSNAIILSARIKVFCITGNATSGMPRSYGIYPITEPVDESSSGNMYSEGKQGPPSYSGYSSLVSWLPGPEKAGWWSFDVTGDVQSWINGQPNYGFLIMDKDSYNLQLSPYDEEWVLLNYTCNTPSAVGNPVLEITWFWPNPKIDPPDLKATLVDGVNGTLISGNVNFTVAGTSPGTSWTDSSNSWTWGWYGPQATAAYTAVASYAGNATYQAASDSLVMDFRTPTTLAVNGYTGAQNVMNVSTHESYPFECWVSPPIAASEGVQVLVNNVSQPSLTLGSSTLVSFSWTPYEAGVYYLNFSYGGDADYALSQVNIVAMAQASPVCLSFNATPSEFAPGDTVTLYAQAVNPQDGKALQGVNVTFWQNGTSSYIGPRYVTTGSDGVASVTWQYQSSWSICTVNASVGSDNSIGNWMLAEEPVTLTVGNETQLLLEAWRDPQGTGHTIDARLVDADGSPLGGQNVTITVNGTAYPLQTNQSLTDPDQSGYATLYLPLQPGDTSANTYQVMATFNGTNPRSLSINASDLYGDQYAVCTTNQYDLLPSTNSSTLEVLLQSTDAITAAQTMKQIQEQAEQNGTLSVYNEWSWLYPWYRLHIGLNINGVKIDVGFNPILPGGEEINWQGLGLFSSITADVISEMRLDLFALFAQYLIAKATSIIAWPVAAVVEALKFGIQAADLWRNWNNKIALLVSGVIGLIMGVAAVNLDLAGRFVLAVCNVLVGSASAVLQWVFQTLLQSVGWSMTMWHSWLDYVEIIGDVALAIAAFWRCATL
jgi:hypothetical protein